MYLSMVHFSFPYCPTRDCICLSIVFELRASGRFYALIYGLSNVSASQIACLNTLSLPRW